jgi:CelD/BcsL family acetyltransferase involved in cellulose biosynthesis
VIAAPETWFDARDLLRAAHLTSWEFDHVPSVQLPFALYETNRDFAPIVDLTHGFDAYVHSRTDAGSGRVRQAQRKERKLEREMGALRWVPFVSDEGAVDRVLAAKSEQCRLANIPDVFRFGWARDLLRTILQTQGPGLSGCLSALYSGDDLVAAHAGIRSEHAWHWWFPVYEQRYAKYSPGLILLLAVIREAARLRLDYVDLGKGVDAYKPSFANAAIELSEGRVQRASVGNVVHDLRELAETRLRSSRIADPVRDDLRRANQWLRQRRFR